MSKRDIEQNSMKKRFLRGVSFLLLISSLSLALGVDAAEKGGAAKNRFSISNISDLVLDNVSEVFASDESLDLQQVSQKWLLFYADFYSDNYFERQLAFFMGPIENKIQPFVSDGCSSFPDGLNGDKFLWRDCCMKHDLAYWIGGSAEEKMQADLELKQCVAVSLGNKTSQNEIIQMVLQSLAEKMESGVAIGGSPLMFSPWRWGYGWNYQIGYDTLSKEQMQSVALSLKEYLVSFDRMNSYGLRKTLFYQPNDVKAFRAHVLELLNRFN